MVRWKGQPTNRRITWTATADTFKGLYFELIHRNIISIEDGFPDETYILNKVGLTIYDFEKVEEEWNYDYQKWFEEMTKGIELTEDDYRIIILSENGNAYYQEIEIEED